MFSTNGFTLLLLLSCSTTHFVLANKTKGHQEDSNDEDGKGAVQPEPYVSQMESVVLSYEFKPETNDQLFARLDQDSDGTFNADDYLHRDVFYVENLRREFDKIDENRDGKVSKSEFDAYNKRMAEEQHQLQLQSSNFTLQTFDKNGNEALEENELEDYINSTLLRNTSELHSVFQEYDTDHNGQLSLEEFAQLDFNFPWDRFPLDQDFVAIDLVRPMDAPPTDGNPIDAHTLVEPEAAA
jgi:hypothetical protein